MKLKLALAALMAGIVMASFAQDNKKKDDDKKKGDDTGVVKYSLKWNIEKDKSFTQELTIKGEGAVFGDDGLKSEMAMKFTCKDVKEEKKEKKMNLKYTVQKMKVSLSGMFTVKMDYSDGKWKECELSLPIPSEEGKDPAEKIKAEIAKERGLTLGTDGKTESEEDDNPQMSFTQMFSAGGGNPPAMGLSLPAKDVSVGDTWETKDEQDNARKYKFEKIESVDGKECAFITLKLDMSNDTGMGTMSQKTDGQYWFVIKDGYLLKATMKSGSSVEMQGGQKMEQKMEMSVTTKTDKAEEKPK